MVKKLNPFKRLQTTPVVTFDTAEVTSRRGFQTQTSSLQQQQSVTTPSRSGFIRRDSHERKRNARAAATEKELLHLNNKIVSNTSTVHVLEPLRPCSKHSVLQTCLIAISKRACCCCCCSLLGPFYGAIAVPSDTRCRCCCCRCCGHRCAGGVRQWRCATVATPGKWQCGVRRLAVANWPNIYQMLLVLTSELSVEHEIDRSLS